MARVETSFLNVTLKVLRRRTRKCLQLAPPTPPGVLSLLRWSLEDLLGAKGGGLQDRVWSLGLTFWGDLGRAPQRRPGTAMHVVIAWHQRMLPAATPLPPNTTLFCFVFCFV